MRKKIVCGNWKMNTGRDEAMRLASSIENNLSPSNLEVIVCPPFVYLEQVKGVISKITLGAQNCYSENNGPFTGEISAPQLKDFCSYVILGHSERRKFFKEKDEDISRKVKITIEAGLIPIVCVGETKEERQDKKQNKIIDKQVSSVLEGFSEDQVLKTIFVYEPVWAISTFGTGEICDVSLTLPAVGLIRNIIADKFKKSVSENISVLYGGSVNSSNVKEFAKEKEIDGVLVGAKSLDANDFLKIVKEMEKQCFTQ
ncbi:triose-phosphate isomerase [bacterium CG_4_10_14_0_2_um_filter_33_32]|nr:MAG: triose-phosphate isomerase [bacterium CG2_30_33_46]PIR67297.1 MAG: triose-phosphate isomerase [bacterium CG10_big_fil_rev_8_21_14_0_10_33_18]PIU76688.1 MAG: triose-phosphate isomerase [bacterium CG06_land_8_20_14_3_00_33_50]PIW80760.1 MAG: triose-phosphate isomerase [bacterium CG_4_8_14_3_um_filter_33_28]PIY85218.1 MAG: triose-phosphate isomerase [bacterium CG_4_10_14_0_8_um_filter_33_57]PIZ85727.1 MAG: triose-phosphate isomerase [bacterium CG_4_10_14_0_2_um_filter_33_32]PJA72078.1 MA